MITRDAIAKEIEFYKGLNLRCSKMLKQFSTNEATVYFKTQHGKKRPFIHINGVSHYVSKKNYNLLQSIMNRNEIEHAQKHIEGNIKCLEILLDKYSDPAEAIPAQFDLSEKRDLTKVVAELESRHSGKSGYDNKHTTSTGEMVKSKSELIIFEFLKAKGIKFYYEKPFLINGKKWFPDFALVRKISGEVVLWEHFGMMSNEDYRMSAIQKMYAYAMNGYFPYENIIYTYDDEHGSINMCHIEKILNMMDFV